MPGTVGTAGPSTSIARATVPAPAPVPARAAVLYSQQPPPMAGVTSVSGDIGPVTSGATRRDATGAALRMEDGPCGLDGTAPAQGPGPSGARAGGAGVLYLTVTVAPAPSRAALAFSAASLATFSRTAFGAL